MKDPAQEALEARLAKLPRDIVPPRYLWPSIEREIERQPLRAPQVVLAAAAAVAALMIAAPSCGRCCTAGLRRMRLAHQISR